MTGQESQRPDPAIIIEGNGPVILAMPHIATWLPGDVAADLNETGRALADTDWHIDRLYDGLLPAATIVQATAHRYVIDVNRDPEGTSLYPGQSTTGLIPLTDFDGRPIWTAPPTEKATAFRRLNHHMPYHMALAVHIARLRERHDHVILYDCHSIRSEIPHLFEGRLPDLNIGTNGGVTCAPAIEAAAVAAAAASDFSHVLNGRFKGGWTTRQYGKPAQGVHAIQMEIAQSVYLEAEAPPWSYADSKAERLRAVLRGILERLEALARSGELA
ncbi:MAG: N-formylglutamate deformylase [Pseudomonadota bacterium]